MSHDTQPGVFRDTLLVSSPRRLVLVVSPCWLAPYDLVQYDAIVLCTYVERQSAMFANICRSTFVLPLGPAMIERHPGHRSLF